MATGVDRGNAACRQDRGAHHLPRWVSQHAGARPASYRAEREGGARLRSRGRDVGARALPGGRDLFEKLMHDEEEHIDYLETQLDLVAKLGLELYAQHHMGKTDDDHAD